MKLVAKLWLPIFTPKSGKMQHKYYFLMQIKNLLVKFLLFLWAPIIKWDDSPEIWLFMHQIYFLNLFNELFYHILLMFVQKTVYMAINLFLTHTVLSNFFQSDFMVWVTGKFIKIQL